MKTPGTIIETIDTSPLLLGLEYEPIPDDDTGGAIIVGRDADRSFIVASSRRPSRPVVDRIDVQGALEQLRLCEYVEVCQHSAVTDHFLSETLQYRSA